MIHSCWMAGEFLNDRQLIEQGQTIAHEIAHVMVGYGHPDDGTSEIAKLPETRLVIGCRSVETALLPRRPSRLHWACQACAATVW